VSPSSQTFKEMPIAIKISLPTQMKILIARTHSNSVLSVVTMNSDNLQEMKEMSVLNNALLKMKQIQSISYGNQEQKLKLPKLDYIKIILIL